MDDSIWRLGVTFLLVRSKKTDSNCQLLKVKLIPKIANPSCDAVGRTVGGIFKESQSVLHPKNGLRRNTALEREGYTLLNCTLPCQKLLKHTLPNHTLINQLKESVKPYSVKQE